MRALLKVLVLLAFAAAAAAYPLAWIVDSSAGQDLLVVQPVDRESLEVNRGLWELDGSPKDQVASLYGIPGSGPVRIVFADEARVLHPEEDPSLALFLSGDDVHPVQAQTLYFFAARFAIGGILAGIAGLGLLWLTGRKAGSRPGARGPDNDGVHGSGSGEGGEVA